MVLAGLLAGASMLLAAIGIHGLIAGSIAERTREIGIRMALGAQPAHVMRQVLGQGAGLLAAGVGLGIGASFLALQLIRTLLYGTSPHDPVSLGLVVVFLAGAALISTPVPGMRCACHQSSSVMRSAGMPQPCKWAPTPRVVMKGTPVLAKASTVERIAARVLQPE